MLCEGNGFCCGDEVDAGEEVDNELELGVFFGRVGASDGGDGVGGPEADEAGVVVGAPATVEGGEVDLFGDGAEFGGEVGAAGDGCDYALKVFVSEGSQ